MSYDTLLYAANASGSLKSDILVSIPSASTNILFVIIFIHRLHPSCLPSAPPISCSRQSTVSCGHLFGLYQPFSSVQLQLPHELPKSGAPC